MLFLRDRSHRRFVGGACGDDHGLVAQIAVGADAGRARYQELGSGDEKDRREGDLLLALEIRRRRAAFEVDLARADGRDPRLGGDLPVFDRDFCSFELVRDLLYHRVA